PLLHANASSTGRRAGSGTGSARVDRRVRAPRTADRAPNSSPAGPMQARATALGAHGTSTVPRINEAASASSTGRGASAATQGARTDRGAFAPAKDRRKAQAAHAGRRESREKMRIVGGRLRGRVLLAPSSRAVRPTSERLRESIFDILEHRFPGRIEGARVVDLFAGSGALAIEALSRGARFALFVDNGAEARAVLRANVEALALGGVTRIWRADAANLGKAPAGPPFTLAFLDPPYGENLAGPALAALARGQWLSEGALCAVEEDAKSEIGVP